MVDQPGVPYVEERQNEYGHVKKRTVILTDAQIKALPTTAVELVPAPGVGKMLRLLMADLQIRLKEDYADMDVTEAILAIACGGPQVSSGIVNSSVDTETGLTQFLAAGADEIATALLVPHARHLSADFGLVANIASASNANPFENLPLTLYASNSDVDFTGGDVENTLTVTVYYVEIDV